MINILLTYELKFVNTMIYLYALSFSVAQVDFDLC